MPVGEALALAGAKTVLEKVAPSFLAAGAEKIGKTVDHAKAKFFKTFQSHLTVSLRRSRQVKTVVSKDKAVSLEAIYVPLFLASDFDNEIADTLVSPTNSFGARNVVSGTGGAGKTVLMKHLLNLSVDNPNGMVPLFFEMRTIDFSQSEHLHECMYNDLQLAGGSESAQLFEYALQEGVFAIFLDGFDEIKPEWQELALRRIDTFSRRFGKVSIIISTRPNTGAEGLQDFTTFHLKGLTKQQALEVVEKTPFERVTKDKFHKALDEVLYDRHQTMMSIPILVAMMLLTFRSYSDIPDRMTVFYAQAFDTLYAIHDSENKLQFKRSYRSKLAPDLFHNVLEAFCFLSLQNHDIEFTHNSFMDYIGKAIKLNRVECSAQDFATDLIQNVCILQKDGITYAFVHRSFQEYFAAIFALNYSGENPFKIMNQISASNRSAAAAMMDEIDNAKFRRTWLLPKLEQLTEELTSVSDAPLYVRLSKIASWINIHNGRLRNMQFGGEASKLFEGFEAIGQFCEGVRIVDVFLPDRWVSREVEIDLLKAARSGEPGLSIDHHGDEKHDISVGITATLEVEKWLQRTALKANLDTQLANLLKAREEVRKFVSQQDNLESELLNV